MSFSENLNRICRDRGTTVTALLKNMGISTSKVTMWNNGSLPKQEMLLKLSQELHCSIMDFFQDEGDLGKEQIILTEDEQEIVKFYRKITLKEQHIFMARMYAYEEEMMKRKE
jgi:transcriptional regulator with XRE-family HTH domain